LNAKSSQGTVDWTLVPITYLYLPVLLLKHDKHETPAHRVHIAYIVEM